MMVTKLKEKGPLFILQFALGMVFSLRSFGDSDKRTLGKICLSLERHRCTNLVYAYAGEKDDE